MFGIGELNLAGFVEIQLGGWLTILLSVLFGSKHVLFNQRISKCRF